MVKQLKEGRKYFVINIDEPYAEKIFEVLKEEQKKLGDWPEGDITFEEWVKDAFGEEGIEYIKNSKKK